MFCMHANNGDYQDAFDSGRPVSPGWKRDASGCIVLSGHWSLLVDARQRQRLLHEFEQLAAPRDCHWCLHDVDALDSTGALLLWQVWGRQLPARLDWSAAQRNLFQWLEGMEPLAQPARFGGTRWLQRLGAGVLQVLQSGGGIFVLLGRLLLDVAYCVRHPRVTPWLEISANIRHIGAS